MLNEIRGLFRRSVEAFRAELGVKEPEDQVADLLLAMRRELVSARAAIPEFEASRAHATAELEREREALGLCERRRAQAERIGDAETVRVAEEFAARHRARIGVLEKKVAATEAELLHHRLETEEMTRRYREADANRFVLLAQIRQAAARQRARGGAGSQPGPFADFERMEEKVEHTSAYVDALEELEDRPASERDRAAEQRALEERLRELKRRMGRAE